MDGFTHRHFGGSPAMARSIGMGGFGKTPNLVQDASELTSAGYVVQAPASANILDAFGSANRQYVMYGLGALALVAVVKMLK